VPLTIHEVIERANRAFNDHDLDAFTELSAPDSEFRAPGGVVLHGRDAIREFTAAWFEAFPDSRSDMRRTLIVDDTVIGEGVFTGTHTGVYRTPAGDLPPTGKEVKGAFMEIFDVKDGMVVRDHMMFDRLDLLGQLGLIPGLEVPA
jgi:steroid delta-isomerase-like uncharacterized protein